MNAFKIVLNGFEDAFRNGIANKALHSELNRRSFLTLIESGELGVMLIVNIIYTAFMVWLICLFFTFLESLWEERKN